MFDKILISIFSLGILATIALLVILIPQDIEKTDRAKEIAKELNCEYLGSARDMGSIKFLDCNGTIKLIRVK